MGLKCKSCGQAKNTNKLAEYTTDMLGIPLTLINAVSITKCGCDFGDNEDIEIPNLRGLMAAASITRAFIPSKLSGREVKFMRKAIDMPAKDLAKFLEVTPETLSRWENDKKPVSTAIEKLFRFVVVAKSGHEAPAIDLDLKELSSLEINGFASPGSAIPLCFGLVRFKGPNQKPEDEYEEIAA